MRRKLASDIASATACIIVGVILFSALGDQFVPFGVALQFSMVAWPTVVLWYVSLAAIEVHRILRNDRNARRGKAFVLDIDDVDALEWTFYWTILGMLLASVLVWYGSPWGNILVSTSTRWPTIFVWLAAFIVSIAIWLHFFGRHDAPARRAARTGPPKVRVQRDEHGIATVAGGSLVITIFDAGSPYNEERVARVIANKLETGEL